MNDELRIAVLGLGEAGSHFANDLAAMGVKVTGYDPNPVRKLHPSIVVKESNAEAARDAEVIFSTNLSSVSVEIAEELVGVVQPNQFFCEMNTSGPTKKQKIASVLASSGVKVIDLAIMAPVPPKGIMTPLLASGEYAAEFLEKVKPLHLDLKQVENSQIGEAATRKLLRSIVYKGIAAVVCEAMEAGKAFGMENYIREQISSLIGGNDDLIDRFVEGSKTHALRRMHEMEAVMELAAPNGGAINLIMVKATRDNLRNLAKNKEKGILPLGVRAPAIPYMQFRGGSSKGLFFKAEDLPTDETLRNQVILAVMDGVVAGDPRQIDGLGGANSLTSKVAIVSPAKSPDADLDYFFIQVVVGKGRVSTIQSCGNILAGVLPFAIESGMIPAQHPITSARIKIVNTGGICEVIVQTPNGQVEYAGTARVDGVLGTAAPIVCNYLYTAGSTCGSLLPTGQVKDNFDGVEVTCIDNGMPLVVMRASDFGITGYESKDELEANEVLKKRVESLRLQAGTRMSLGEVSEQTIPKMCLIAPARQGGMVTTRMFIPHTVHEAIGVLAAVSVATACILPGSVAEGIAAFQKEQTFFSVEHPSGEFTVNLEYSFQNGVMNIKKSGVIRTARLLSKGEVFIP